jgi:hypothetical protein
MKFAIVAAIFATSFMTELVSRKKRPSPLHDVIRDFRLGFSEGYRHPGLQSNGSD